MHLKENERIDDLQYKGLKIIQDKTAFCFGIDSVLLSDFAKEIKNNGKVADLGTGNGIVGLLLCKKTFQKVVAFLNTFTYNSIVVSKQKPT